MATLEREYVERQRERLLELRRQLSVATPPELEERALAAQSAGESAEPEEAAQRLATLEVDGRLVARDQERRRNVERALQKIAEGTYGLSDESGEPIGKQRLDSTPEAIYSVADEEARERRTRAGLPERQ